MAHQTISKLTKDFVRIPVTAQEAGVAVNPTTLVVEMAFTTGTDPITTDWKVAAWETAGSTYFARLLVGGVGSGATLELAAGQYVGWVRITGAPEKPVIRAPNLLEVV